MWFSLHLNISVQPPMLVPLASTANGRSTGAAVDWAFLGTLDKDIWTERITADAAGACWRPSVAALVDGVHVHLLAAGPVLGRARVVEVRELGQRGAADAVIASPAACLRREAAGLLAGALGVEFHTRAARKARVAVRLPVTACMAGHMVRTLNAIPL